MTSLQNTLSPFSWIRIASQLVQSVVGVADFSVVIVTVCGRLKSVDLYFNLLILIQALVAQLPSNIRRYTGMDKVQTFGRMVDREKCFEESGPQKKPADSTYSTSSSKRKLTRARKQLP